MHTQWQIYSIPLKVFYCNMYLLAIDLFVALVMRIIVLYNEFQKLNLKSSFQLTVTNLIPLQLICIDPLKGELIRTVPTPYPNMTSVCWGGEDYGTLYATSGIVGLSEEELAAIPKAGGVLEITGTGSKGRAPVPVELNDELIRKIDG